MEVSDPSPAFVTKNEMARCLRVSLPTLTNWIEKWADFPIAERGTNGAQYKFDVQAVFDFLASKKEEEARLNEGRDAKLEQAQLAFDEFLPRDDDLSVVKLKLKDQIDIYKIRQMRLAEAKTCGHLVPVEALREILRDVFTRLGRESRIFIRRIGRDNQWPDALIAKNEAAYEQLQSTVVATLTQELQPIRGDHHNECDEGHRG